MTQSYRQQFLLKGGVPPCLVCYSRADLRDRREVKMVYIACDRSVRVRLMFRFSWRRALNRLTPNDPYMGRIASLTSKRCTLCIYSTNVGTEYFKHALYSRVFSLQNAVCFIMLTCLVPVLFTFYIQDVLKLKKKQVALIMLIIALQFDVSTSFNM